MFAQIISVKMNRYSYYYVVIIRLKKLNSYLPCHFDLSDFLSTYVFQ